MPNPIWSRRPHYPTFLHSITCLRFKNSSAPPPLLVSQVCSLSYRFIVLFLFLKILKINYSDWYSFFKHILAPVEKPWFWKSPLNLHYVGTGATQFNKMLFPLNYSVTCCYNSDFTIPNFHFICLFILTKTQHSHIVCVRLLELYHFIYSRVNNIHILILGCLIITFE